MTPLRDAALDLLLGGSCVGCGEPGRLLCELCSGRLPRGAERLDLRGPAPTYATGAYAGVLRALILGHKERRLLALAPVLGTLVAQCVVTALAEAGARGPTVLVPVPSRASAVRARGHDPTLAMVRAAARSLGPDVSVARLLRLRPGVVDQAGLDVAARSANLDRSMACRSRPLRVLARDARPAHVVVCDDVVTTGSTTREARRALEAVGVLPLATASVAATPRRSR